VNKSFILKFFEEPITASDIAYYKNIHSMLSIWKADLKAAYFAEIGRPSFSSAL
jgi:hypothetical protein